ncbi:MAG: YceI family protein [Roseivirga sp.]|nr:YceI family protein [Roseivirga sp.]
MLRSIIASALLCFSFSLYGQKFIIDPGHTAVTSKVQRFSMVDVLGRFNEVEGSITYDSNDLSKLSAEVTIKTASYTSNNLGGEDAVKSVAFLDVANFPEMTFKSTKVVVSGEEFNMTGNLTIHGVTKEVTFPFTLLKPFKDPTRANTIATSASLTINRQDFGIKFSRKLPNGKEFIGNEVHIELNVLAVEQ